MRDYVLTLLVTAAVTYLLTPLVRRLAGRIGAMKEPRDRDVHVAPVPLIGGVAMYGGLAAGLLVADQIPQLRTAFAHTGMTSGLLLAGGLLVAIGIVDDRWGMSALTKAAGQVAAGGILVATGTQLSWLPEPGGGTFIPTTGQSTVLTILIVVATINAVNFIDGLDGLAAGIVCIAAVSFFLYYYELAKVINISALAAPALASAVLIGMCVGFLPHNFSPASIFMGDTGAMLLGLLLAYAPISAINSLDSGVLTQINRYPVIMPLVLPAALLVIPYADLLLAVVRRTKAGKSPFAPDRKHLHHRLLDIGHSQRASVLIMYLWGASFSGIIVWLSIEKTLHTSGNHHGVPVYVFVAVTAAAVAALLLMSMPRLRWWERAPRPAAVAPAGYPEVRHPEPPALRPDAHAQQAVPQSPAELVTVAAAASDTAVADMADADLAGWVRAAVTPRTGGGPEANEPDPAVPPDAAARLDYGAGLDLVAGTDQAGWAAPDRRSRLIAPAIIAADVTSPDLAAGDLAAGGLAGADPAPADTAARSVVGSVPPAVTTSGARGPGPQPLPRRTPAGLRRETENGSPQADWFGNTRGDR